MRIRIASPADAQAVNAVYDYYIGHTVATFNEINKTVGARAQEIGALLETYPFLIAEDDSGRFLGFANAEPVRPQSGYRYSAELTIYLHPDAPKRCGIGSALYERLLEILTAQGFQTVYAVLYSHNEESRRLHARFGFEQAAIIRRCAYKHGQWLDALILQKALGAYDDPPAQPVPFSSFRSMLKTVEWSM